MGGGKCLQLPPTQSGFRKHLKFHKTQNLPPRRAPPSLLWAGRGALSFLLVHLCRRLNIAQKGKKVLFCKVGGGAEER